MARIIATTYPVSSQDLDVDFFLCWAILLDMKTHFVKIIRRLGRSEEDSSDRVVDALTYIAADVSSKRREVTDHRAKAQHAIDNGTKLSKRRVPL